MTEPPSPFYGSNPGDMIRYIRKERGISIVELATKMGVSQAYISRLERGEVKPTMEQVEVIKSFLTNL